MSAWDLITTHSQQNLDQMCFQPSTDVYREDQLIPMDCSDQQASDGDIDQATRQTSYDGVSLAQQLKQ
ncbi:hypothetical protein SS50377_23803 [Spironucleus salmonicida]|uniref:Uncharacterized protein n=1 Tax=Spironucleus salmonicida TaxID=348837 RepID=V6LS13_9EUKA|nr:hypothetical protein SS50377_23803 [Spironucleus salmonicida]|eukprot:EST46481.1 Hypothetical protein SS50377_13563 [Spironucleus salmonicida]